MTAPVHTDGSYGHRTCTTVDHAPMYPQSCPLSRPYDNLLIAQEQATSQILVHSVPLPACVSSSQGAGCGMVGGDAGCIEAKHTAGEERTG